MDQTFLNGKLLGQDTKIIPANFNASLDDITKLDVMWNVVRNYSIPVNDPRLRWDEENVLTVRVYDSSGDGGMSSLPVTIRMKDFKDYLVFDIDSKVLETKPDGMLSKTILLKNLSVAGEIKGKLTMTITNAEDKKVVASQTYDIALNSGEKDFTINFKGDLSKRMTATYTFIEPKLNNSVVSSQDLVYILTPKPAETPKINGAKVVGVGRSSFFQFHIPATGNRPMTFSAENLPAGLMLDPVSGDIRGLVRQAGEYIVKLKVSNNKGKAVRNLKIVVGDRLALTPPMGWNSWNAFGPFYDEKVVRQSTDVFVKKGLIDHGWTYINLDLGWEPMDRQADGKIVPNDKFKDMKALTDYIHSFCLKAGIYISTGPRTCVVSGKDFGIGTYQHEEQDAQTFADWGFDYLKDDWCTYGDIIKEHGLREYQKPYRLMKEALAKTKRDIVFSICQYGMGNVWQWGDSVGGNLWRTVSDITDTWKSVSGIGFNQEAGAPFSKPGRWNDPDMLVIGEGVFGGVNLPPHPSRLTPSEQYTHISLWALLSAPLFIGCDLTKLDDFTMNLLTNDEVIDIDQDSLGKQALPVIKNPEFLVMLKELEDGSKAVGLFNRSANDLSISVPWDILKINGEQKVRDVWKQKDLGMFSNSFAGFVPPHGVLLLRISK